MIRVILEMYYNHSIVIIDNNNPMNTSKTDYNSFIYYYLNKDSTRELKEFIKYTHDNNLYAIDSTDDFIDMLIKNLKSNIPCNDSLTRNNVEDIDRIINKLNVMKALFHSNSTPEIQEMYNILYALYQHYDLEKFYNQLKFYITMYTVPTKYRILSKTDRKIYLDHNTCEDYVIHAPISMIRSIEDNFGIECEKLKENDAPNTKRWRAHNGKSYYYITESGDIDTALEVLSKEDDWRYISRNYFKSVEDAEFSIERTKVLYELEKYSINNNKLLYDPNINLYILYYNHEYVTADVSVLSMYHIQYNTDGIMFMNVSDAYDAIEKIGKDRIKKYYFGIVDD